MIALDRSAQERLTILTHLLAAELTLAEAAVCLGLSGRQVRQPRSTARRRGRAARARQPGPRPG